MTSEARRNQLDRLADMGRALTAITNTGSSIRRASIRPLDEKSHAELDFEWWTEQPYDDAWFIEMFDSGLKSLYAAEDALRTAAARLSDPASPFSTMSLFRSSLESSGRARWLFAPGLDPVDRAQRFAREVDKSIRESHGIAATLGRNDPGLHEEGQRIGALAEKFANQTGGWRQSVPTLAKRVIALFQDELFAADAKAAARAGKLAYQALSDSAHANKRGLDIFLPGVISRGDSDPPTAHPPGWFEYFAWAGGWGYIIASHRAFEYLGWDDPQWKDASVTFGGRLSVLRGDKVPDS